MDMFQRVFHGMVAKVLFGLVLVVFGLYCYKLVQLRHATAENARLVAELRTATAKIEAIERLSTSTATDSANFSLRHTIIKKDEKIMLLTNSNLSMLERMRTINAYIKQDKR